MAGKVVHLKVVPIAKPKPKKLNRITKQQGYRWNDRDQDMIFICDLIDKSGLGIGEVLERVLDVSNNSIHISYGCIDGWLRGRTRRPQNFTLSWVALALGYKRQWEEEDGKK